MNNYLISFIIWIFFNYFQIYNHFISASNIYYHTLIASFNFKFEFYSFNIRISILLFRIIYIIYLYEQFYKTAIRLYSIIETQLQLIFDHVYKIYFSCLSINFTFVSNVLFFFFFHIQVKISWFFMDLIIGNKLKIFNYYILASSHLRGFFFARFFICVCIFVNYRKF